MPEQGAVISVEVGPASSAATARRSGSPARLFRPWDPDQAGLLPASKRDYLGDAHLAVFLRDLLEQLDLGPVLDAYTEDRGQPPYDPRMMTVPLLYAYRQGITSSRQIERRCREGLALMYLTADAQPDHDTLRLPPAALGRVSNALFGDPAGGPGRGGGQAGAHRTGRHPGCAPTPPSTRQ